MSSEFKKDAEERAKGFVDSVKKTPEEAPAAPPHGVVNARVVRIAFFVLFSLSLFVTALFWILAVWELVDWETALRIISSFGILVFALFLFAVANEALAGKVDI